MAFRFNFSNPNGKEDEVVESLNDISTDQSKDFLAPFREIDPSSVSRKYADDVRIISYKLSGSLEVECYDNTNLERKFADSNTGNSAIAKAVTSNSDLITSVYEGGLTVWECGVDLAKFIANGNIDVKNKKVLELGCGAGIPGLCAMKLGAKEVHFQDYNADVIETYTIPNALGLNDVKNCKTSFFSGDWSEMSRAAKDGRDLQYDIILTAETIYSPGSYGKLHDCFSTMLKSEGSIFVAAKSNYFGVGGGTRTFEQFVHQKDKFCVEIVEEILAGVPREILKLSWNKVA